MGESGDDIVFMGEYHHSLDDKGRVVIPNKFRLKLGSQFVITRGIENCLYVYTEPEWKKIVTKLDALPFTKKDARTFIRTFFSGASFGELDRQGRLNIAAPLVKYAALKRDVMIIGANNRFEIWSNDNWNQFLKANNSKLEDIAENLFTDCDS